jgi:hypothetical protein
MIALHREMGAVFFLPSLRGELAEQRGRRNYLFEHAIPATRLRCPVEQEIGAREIGMESGVRRVGQSRSECTLRLKIITATSRGKSTLTNLAPVLNA